MKAKNLMYIKQILYLLEKFVTVLGGKEHPRPRPAAEPAGLRSPGASQDPWGFCLSGIALAIDLGNSYLSGLRSLLRALVDLPVF